MTIPPTLPNYTWATSEMADKKLCNRTPTIEKITENPNTKKTLA